MPVTEMIRGREVTIPDVSRVKTEVWTRVVGYYRPVSSFNIGQVGMHSERKHYTVSGII